MLHGFKKGVSVDVLYLKINYILEYNLPYMQSDFMCNPGPKIKLVFSAESNQLDFENLPLLIVIIKKLLLSFESSVTGFAKFFHFAKISKALGNFVSYSSVFGQYLNILWCKFYAPG